MLLCEQADEALMADLIVQLCTEIWLSVVKYTQQPLQ